MSSKTASRLYTPAMLALAAGLADFPLTEALPLRAEGRSRTCGSTLALGLALGDGERIEGIGLRISACAVGQASAALLAQGCAGRPASAILAGHVAIAAWLEGACELPDWPGLAVLAPVRDHTGRHGALLLPWTTACEALSSGASAG